MAQAGADLSVYRFIGLLAQAGADLSVYRFIGLSAQAGADLSVYRFIGLSAQAGADLSVYRFIGLSVYRRRPEKTGRATTLYFLISVSQESATSSFCVRETFALLGFLLDSEKTQIPSEVAHVLGVVINTSALQRERHLQIEPKPTRRKNLIFMIDRILSMGELQPSVAASLIGKFGFLCSTMYGKVGRCCTNSIRARQYSLSGDTSLNRDIVISLKLMKLFTESASPRMQSVDDCQQPVILYTDASDVPERIPRFAVGAVVFDPDSEVFQRTYWAVPQEVVNHWITKETYMGQLEILAGPLAIATWHSLLHRRQLGPALC